MEHNPEVGTQHILMAGDSRDVWNLRRILASLPPTAYGQVFVEVESAAEIQDMPTPDGITVSWLRRDQMHDASTGELGLPRGEAVALAVRAWADEWMPGDTQCACGCGTEVFYVWIGCSMSPSVDELYSTLGVTLGSPGQPLP